MGLPQLLMEMEVAVEEAVEVLAQVKGVVAETMAGQEVRKRGAQVEMVVGETKTEMKIKGIRCRSCCISSGWRICYYCLQQ